MSAAPTTRRHQCCSDALDSTPLGAVSKGTERDAGRTRTGRGPGEKVLTRRRVRQDTASAVPKAPRQSAAPRDLQASRLQTRPGQHLQQPGQARTCSRERPGPGQPGRGRAGCRGSRATASAPAPPRPPWPAPPPPPYTQPHRQLCDRRLSVWRQQGAAAITLRPHSGGDRRASSGGRDGRPGVSNGRCRECGGDTRQGRLDESGASRARSWSQPTRWLHGHVLVEPTEPRRVHGGAWTWCILRVRAGAALLVRAGAWVRAGAALLVRAGAWVRAGAALLVRAGAAMLVRAGAWVRAGAALRPWTLWCWFCRVQHVAMHADRSRKLPG